MGRRIEVVGAVIVRDGRVLCAQRAAGDPLAGRWEFPGGKIEPGESPEAALVREIAEELGCRIEVGDLVVTASHEHAFATVTMTTYFCTLAGGEPTLLEHADLRWVAPGELGGLDWSPVDLPTVRRIDGRTEAG